MNAGPNPFARLTRQQRETMQALRAAGWLYKEAAIRLGVPESTIRSRVSASLRRAKVSDRADLAYWMAAADQNNVDIRPVPDTRPDISTTTASVSDV